MYSEKLKEIRKKLKLSQEELATQTGTSYRAYTSYERGDRKPSLEFLEKIATLFDVNLNWLLANIGEVFIGQNNKQENTSTGDLKKDILLDVRKMLIKEGIIK